VLTHANMAAGVECLVAAWGWGHDDRLLLALPLFHVHGLCAGLFGSLTAGAPAVVHERFSPGRVLAAAGDVSMFFGVPTMYHRLAAIRGAGSFAPSGCAFRAPPRCRSPSSRRWRPAPASGCSSAMA